MDLENASMGDLHQICIEIIENILKEFKEEIATTTEVTRTQTLVHGFGSLIYNLKNRQAHVESHAESYDNNKFLRDYKELLIDLVFKTDYVMTGSICICEDSEQHKVH